MALDYNQFVPEEREMWLGAIERDARAGRYNSRHDMRAAVAQIAANARAYNTGGRGSNPSA